MYKVTQTRDQKWHPRHKGCLEQIQVFHKLDSSLLQQGLTFIEWLLRSRYCSKCFVHRNTSNCIGPVVIPLDRMVTLRPREGGSRSRSWEVVESGAYSQPGFRAFTGTLCTAHGPVLDPGDEGTALGRVVERHTLADNSHDDDIMKEQKWGPWGFITVPPCAKVEAPHKHSSP